MREGASYCFTATRFRVMVNALVCAAVPAGERSVSRKRPFFAEATKGKRALLSGLGAGFPGVALGARASPLATGCDLPSAVFASLRLLRGSGNEACGLMRRGGSLRSAAHGVCGLLCWRLARATLGFHVAYLQTR
jgi:hypothetical protein